MPLWILFAVMAVYPAATLYFARLRRRRLRQLGKCVRCGYDLTGNITGVCSECGGKIESAP